VMLAVALTARAALLKERADRDPATESHERQARRAIDVLAEALSERDSCEPDKERDRQSREDVSCARLERSAGGLGAAPSLLAGDQRNRNPVGWGNRMQNADRGDRADQQERRCRTHFRALCACRCAGSR